jgi:Pyridine nucleotide-disulphide oxidoreductase
MRGRDVFVAGGGNSAGQAALHLAKWADRVTVLVRTKSLADSMSDYLIRQIGSAPNVDVCYHVQVAGGTGTGTGHLNSLMLEDIASGARRSVPADALFVLIGSHPRTQWLVDSIARDRRGSSSPARTCQPPPATTGPPTARHCHRRPACRGCSQPVTCAADRSTGSLPRSAKARPPSPWFTATCIPPRPGLRQRPSERAHARRAQRDRHPTPQEAENGAGYDRRKSTRVPPIRDRSSLSAGSPPPVSSTAPARFTSPLTFAQPSSSARGRIPRSLQQADARAPECLE